MLKSIKLTYLKKSKKFLDKYSDIISENDVDNIVINAIRKKVYKQNINIDLKDLKGILKGKLRIRKGKLRIIIQIIEDEIIIESII